MNCVICKKGYKKEVGITRFWRQYTFHLCGCESCSDESLVKINDILVREGKGKGGLQDVKKI